jgi:hypothetical protein
MTFASLLRDDASGRLPSLELVALVEENADLLPVSPDGLPFEEQLADRLLALDLPKRAEGVLEKLVKAAGTDAGRAGYGARLGALRLREGNAPGALAALAETSADDIPSALREQRAILAANATARGGNPAAAVDLLSPHSSAAADEARAGILEGAQDWPAAERALAAYVSRIVPDEGDLTDSQRRALLRLATAAARAGDDGVLSSLRSRHAGRIGAGPLADMFRLLTAEPVLGSADLPRARREASKSGIIPAGLAAFPPRPATR